MNSSSKSVYVFIDASNLWQAQKAKGKLLDLKKLKDYLARKFQAGNLKIFYYSAYPAEGTRGYSIEGKHKFFTFLKKGLGFVVRKKELKRIRIVSGEGEAFEEKGNMDVELTIDAIHHVAKYEIAILFSGDSDFMALVNYIRSFKKEVYIFSSKNNISQELRTGGNGYVEILDITEDVWGRNLEHRKTD